jgi:SAM-dependent methyltransferase
VAVKPQLAPPPVEWEFPKCLLCGSPHARPFVSGLDIHAPQRGLRFQVLCCSDCGLCYTSPRPTSETIAAFYPANYGPHRILQKHRECSPLRRWTGLRKEREWLPWYGQGRLLDFGCGSGSWLARMQRQGWDVTGVEMSAEAAERGRKELGVPILTGTLPHRDLASRQFDVITMWNSLEHVHEPAETLAEARRLLAPEGKLLVSVPNLASLSFRWFGEAWYGLDLPRHLVHFTPDTLTRMLRLAGFQPGLVRMIRRASWLRWSAELASRARRGGCWGWLRGKAVSRLATWYSALCGQADCMLVTATPAIADCRVQI